MIPLPLLGQTAGDEDRVNGTLLHDGQVLLTSTGTTYIHLEGMGRTHNITNDLRLRTFNNATCLPFVPEVIGADAYFKCHCERIGMYQYGKKVIRPF
jgi:hypothetical protein